MFDKLIESTRDKKQSRTGRIFFLTSLVYVMMMGVVAIATILGLNPTLAESYSAIDLIPPNLPSEPQPRPLNVTSSRTPATAATQASNVVPLHPPDVADLATINLHRELVVSGPNRPCEICRSGVVGSPVGLNLDTDSVTPPPPPKPKATPESTPEPKATPKQILKVSSISPGMALRRVTPQYSAMARAMRLSGAVQVQILISEEGQVMSAEAVSGHPILRPLAVEAARQWLFKPTILNDVPVKVQGVLTFNFTLN